MQSDMAFGVTQPVEDIGLVSLGDVVALTCGSGRTGREDKRYVYS
jgi:hypothetical protein